MGMESPKGVTKTETDYILTNRPVIIIEVTIINQGKIGNALRMAMSKSNST